MKLDRVYAGSIPALDDRRLVFRRGWHAPPWLLLCGAFVLQVFAIGVTRASDRHGMVFACATTASFSTALITNLVLFLLVLPGMALDRSLMPRVRRSLVIDRVEGGGGSPGFRVTVDGEPLPPTLRRALFELRDELTNAHVLVVGTRAVVLQAYDGRRLADPAFEAESATKALLMCDRQMRPSYGARSLMPLLQASMNVLELDPRRLGAFEAPRSTWFLPSRGTFMSPEGMTSRIQRLSCESEVQSLRTLLVVLGACIVTAAWHLGALLWLRSSLEGMGSCMFALVTAAACVLPTVLLLYLAASRLYAKGLNGRARMMIDQTPA